MEHAVYWQIAAAANVVVTVAYFGISWTIARALIASGQLRTNRLGAATSAIFFTCAVGHGLHPVRSLLDGVTGGAATTGLPFAIWDVATAGIGVYYWTLRRSYGRLLEGGPSLFVDTASQRRRALEINDDIVQSLAVADYALDLGENEQARLAVRQALRAAHSIMGELLGEPGAGGSLGPGDLRRSVAAAPLPAPRT